MRKSKLYQLFVAAFALAFVGCSQDDEWTDGQDNSENVTSKDAVFMNVTVQLPVAGAGSRSNTDTDTGDDYGSSSSGVEVGRDHENVVNTVLLVLAEKGTNKFIACGSQNGFATPSDGKINTVQSIDKTKLADYYEANDEDEDGTLDSGKNFINVYVFCNPTKRLQETLEGLSYGDEWIDKKGQVIENANGTFPATPVQDGGAVWGGSDHRQGFLMSTAKANDIEKRIPNTLDAWNNHNTAEKAFDLTGKNYSGSGEIDNGVVNGTSVGSIDVERAVARFDFKDGSPLAPDAPRTYNVVKFREGEPEVEKTLIQIELTKMALMNMSKEFYYLRRVSNDGMGKDATFPESNSNKFAYSGVETNTNYVVDTDPDFKKTANLNNVGNKQFADHFNFCLGDILGDKWTINEDARSQWYTSEISTVLGGLDDDDEGWTATDKTGYHIWRYAVENTIPSDSKNQRHGVSTGVVFKGKMIVPEALKDHEKYSELYKKINNVDNALTGNSDEDPILYSHSGNLYLTWKEVRAVAIQEKEKYPMFYKAVFGTPDPEKAEPKAEVGTKDEEGYEAPVYSTDENSADYWWARWQDNASLPADNQTDDTEAARVKFKQIATDEGAEFTLYQSSIEGEGSSAVKGYFCYYYYYNRHNSNGDPTNMGAMEFSVVRNNVYKLAVTSINELGHPRLSENDPTPENPENPDEEGKIYFKVSVEVLPWVVRVNNIEF